MGGNSVYGELKLSEKLSKELNTIRSEVSLLQESLEEAQYLRDTYQSEMIQLREKEVTDK